MPTSFVVSPTLDGAPGVITAPGSADSSTIDAAVDAPSATEVAA